MLHPVRKGTTGDLVGEHGRQTSTSSKEQDLTRVPDQSGPAKSACTSASVWGWSGSTLAPSGSGWACPR